MPECICVCMWVFVYNVTRQNLNLKNIIRILVCWMVSNWDNKKTYNMFKKEIFLLDRM